MTQEMKPRPELLALAEHSGAVITGKPDGSEPNWRWWIKELKSVLEMAPGILHPADSTGQCRCSRCRFIKERESVLIRLKAHTVRWLHADGDNGRESTRHPINPDL